MKRFLFSLLSVLALHTVWAHAPVAQASTPLVTVTQAWVRGSVQGQSGTGAFMKITAREQLRLIAVSTPVAGQAQVHEMRMQGNVMSMRELEGGLELPAGQAVTLAPGGLHVMLLDLKTALPAGRTLPMTLVFQDAKGAQSKLQITVPVAMRAPH